MYGRRFSDEEVAEAAQQSRAREAAAALTQIAAVNPAYQYTVTYPDELLLRQAAAASNYRYDYATPGLAEATARATSYYEDPLANSYAAPHFLDAAGAADTVAAAARLRAQQQFQEDQPAVWNHAVNGLVVQQPLQQQHTAVAPAVDTTMEEDDDDDEDMASETSRDNPLRGKVLKKPAHESDSDESDEELKPPSSPHSDVQVESVLATPQPRGKPEAMAKAFAASRHVAELEKESVLEKATSGPPPKKTPKKKSVTNRKKAVAQAAKSIPMENRREFLMGEKVPPITPEEYDNLDALLQQFCRVPLLSEFSRPVSVLHPEVATQYAKIISRPVDLGHVCRGVKRRKYKYCRDIRLDMWRVFANCVKYNSHPTNKDAVPSFVSIALHLREYFNDLWHEFMLPSDMPPPPDKSGVMAAKHEIVKASFTKRDQDRKRRIENSGVLLMSKPFIASLGDRLQEFIDRDGCVDALDTEPLFGPKTNSNEDIKLVVQRLHEYKQQLKDVSESENLDYAIEAFYTDLRKCYTEDVLEENPSMRNRFASRLDRWFWKHIVPVHEANSRGVTQSSIWGNIAATLWARESSKKPYWPALCLGILPPPEQREGWHQAVTERNEGRLPERLREQLMVAKKRSEQAQKRQSLSYFLVEFLGTHEFIWVRETDIMENFDPNEDPNKNAKPAPKKSRASRSNTANVVGTKIYQKALDECVWANDEYETVLHDAFELSIGSDDEEGESNYTYKVLAQSDDEAECGAEFEYEVKPESLDISEVDEANWLLSHDGLLDISAEGRKNAKKRAQTLKKKASTKKEDVTKKKKPKADSKEDVKDREKEKQGKKEQKEIEKRRKKRIRDREKSLRSEARKKARRRRTGTEDGGDDDEQGLSHDKRLRATAIAKSYVSRMAQETKGKSLAFGSMMSIPAAMIDSVGIMGMSLAFRAACGEFKMPDDGPEQKAKIEPWTAIDSKNPSTAAERVALLQKQIELVSESLELTKTNTAKRRHLTTELLSARDANHAKIEAQEVLARHNPYKKKKKATTKPETPVSAPSASTETTGSLADVESEAENVPEVSAEVTPADMSDADSPAKEEAVEDVAVNGEAD